MKYNDTWDFLKIEDDLAKLVNREVDVVDKHCISNPVRKKVILSSSEVVYAAN
jgi:predicted nucleotidyltransferase